MFAGASASKRDTIGWRESSMLLNDGHFRGREGNLLGWVCALLSSYASCSAPTRDIKKREEVKMAGWFKVARDYTS